MLPLRDRFIYGSLVVSESSWLFAISVLAGTLFGLQKSPLGLIAIVILLASSLIIYRRLEPLKLNLVTAQILQMVGGVIVIYLVLSSQLSRGSIAIDLGWPGGLSEKRMGAAALGIIFSVGLWWRGARLASAESPTETLSFSFRVGVVVLAILSVLDIALPSNLGVTWVLFPFFGASLIGLALSRIIPAAAEASQPKSWTKVISITVVTILVVGASLTFLNGDLLSSSKAIFSAILNLLALGFYWIFIVPASYLVLFLLGALLRIIGFFTGGRISLPNIQLPSGVSEQVREGVGEPSSIASVIAAVLQWFVVVLMVLALLYLLAKAFGWSSRRRDTQLQGSRESLWGEANLGLDLSSLLASLLPEALRRPKSKRGFLIPIGEPGITEVFRIYFRLLYLAAARDSPKPVWQTPGEYKITLEVLFPRMPVQLATTAFNRACYGYHPASEEEIRQLQEALRETEDEAKKSPA
ncbi:MAG: DUF4129 domain-containing protein [Chloroflexi bacterium]|nr:DUF4129 domain-containing protein [Chloroflexota bacterium]